MQYHEESSPIEIYGTEKSALDSMNCNKDTMGPPTLITVDEDENEQSPSDVVEVRDFIKNEERRKREEEMQGDQYRDNYITNDPRTSTERNRGDIPANVIESCDGKCHYSNNSLTLS